MLFAGAGYTVQLYDVQPERLKVVLSEIEMQLENLAKQNLLRSSIPVREQLTAISTTTDLATCMNGAFHVQVIFAFIFAYFFLSDTFLHFVVFL